jgi:hypothetical protein
VHLFSGGGFIFMGWVFQILAELEPHSAQAADVRARIRGVVFDSSPADVTAGGGLLSSMLAACSWSLCVSQLGFGEICFFGFGLQGGLFAVSTQPPHPDCLLLLHN